MTASLKALTAAEVTVSDGFFVTKRWQLISPDWAGVVAALPLVFLVAWLSYAVHLRLALGHWADFVLDPVHPVALMLLDIHERGLLLPFGFATLLSIPLEITFAFIALKGWTDNPRPWFAKQLVFWAASMVIVFLLLATSRDSTYLPSLLD